jgi:hypothetical protein
VVGTGASLAELDELDEAGTSLAAGGTGGASLGAGVVAGAQAASRITNIRTK